MKKVMLLICLFVCPVLGQGSYSLTPLGDLPGGSFYSRSLGMNDHGQVVGQSNGDQAFIWDAINGMQAIPALPAGIGSCAFAINNSGQVIGHSDSVAEGGFIWDAANGIAGLGDLSGGFYKSEAIDINDSGQVIGSSSSELSDPDTYLGYLEAFIWDSTNGMTGLGVLPGGHTKSRAMAVNNDGYVAGYSHTGGLQENAFLWHNNTGMVDLGFEMTVTDINSLRQITGLTSIDGSLVTVVWDSASGLQTIAGNIGAMSVGLQSINDLSQSVGAADYPAPAGGYIAEAIIWDNENGVRKLIDLCDESADGWSLEGAKAINNHGWIVGTGRNPDGNREAFLLIPEPATLFVMLAAGLPVLLRNRRRRG